MLGAMLNNGISTSLLADGAVIKASVISGCNSWFFQCNWGAAHASYTVRSLLISEISWRLLCVSGHSHSTKNNLNRLIKKIAIFYVSVTVVLLALIIKCER